MLPGVGIPEVARSKFDLEQGSTMKRQDPDYNETVLTWLAGTRGPISVQTRLLFSLGAML